MFDLLRRKSALQAAALAASALLLASCGGSDTEENPAPPPIRARRWVIGASLSDNGNECIRTPASCPPAPPYSTGIFSNGPLWVDTVAARVGGAAKPSLAGGTNYAYAGARTGPVPGCHRGGRVDSADDAGAVQHACCSPRATASARMRS